ncbi:hypothetical protein VNI00_006829 [Paramarasmius palmivorus]|uniref:Uncharacterized protein n=1 Tax=Paramarasmius palmivorus TaxID=297713 RepID=A0AAW0D4Q3_9AGAR
MLHWCSKIPVDFGHVTDASIRRDWGFEFIPTEGQVSVVIQILLNFLPLELVDIIIDQAQYWCRIRFKRRGQGIANARNAVGKSAATCYLTTPRIPAQARVRAVLFLIKSNDQGWLPPSPIDAPVHYSDHDVHSAWSWFEAMIIRQSEEHPNMPSWLGSATSQTDSDDRIGIEMSEEHLIAENVVLVGPSPKRWYLTSNVQAQIYDSEQAVFWFRDSHCAEEADLRWGRRNAREFVELLKPGDRITLVARAKYAGWENGVKCAAVEVFYSV